MLEKVKKALWISSNDFDDEIEMLISAAKLDLGIAGVETIYDQDDLVVRAIITYCRMYFGRPSDGEYDRLKAAYDEQKAQLSTSSVYNNDFERR